MSVKGIQGARDGLPVWLRDDAANKSAKTITVPEGHLYELLSVYGELVATAEVGNRVLEVLLLDPDDDAVWSSSVSAAIAASKKGNIWVTGGAAAAITTARPLLAGTTPDVTVQDFSLPVPCYLPAGYSLVIEDTAAIDADGDDLTTMVHLVDYPLL